MSRLTLLNEWMTIMRFDDYQAAAARTAIYPGAGTGEYPALAYTALGLGEVGELQGKVKKVYRDDEGVITPENRRAIMEELGDVLWYAACMARELGVSLGDVASNNLAKLSDRAARGQLQGSGDRR